MSNILEKTLGSLFNFNDSYTGLHGLFKQCISTKTKKEEAMVIQHYLSLLRERLKDPVIRPNFVSHCLAFVVFCDTLGYPAEFAHIHAINLAQQNTLPEKKMGYAASCCLLREGQELCLLLVNTLVRDLSSSNLAVIGLALSALCSAPLPTEAIATLLPVLRDRLAHPTAYIRCKAIVAVHHLLKRDPTQCCHIVNNLIARLGDEDPHVVVCVITTLSDVIQASPENVSGLVASLVSIQRQILGGRLPPDMVYLGLQAPWTQLSIIRVLPELALTEEDEGAAKEVLVETLAQAGIKEGHTYEPPLRAALVSQCLAALMSLEGPTENSRARTMIYVSSMLTATSSDIKNEGLQLLSLVLARNEGTLNKEQKDAVTLSLDHPDITVRRRALALLAAGASAEDVQLVCGQLFSHASIADPYMKIWLLEQALALIGKYPKATSPDWQLSAFVKFLPLAEEPAMKQSIMKSCRELLLSDNLKPETRDKLLGVLEQHTKAKQAPTGLLMLYVWMLGQFPEMCLQSDGQDDALTRLVTLGIKIHRNSRKGEELLLHAVVACAKACEHPSTKPSNDLSEFIKQVQKVHSELEAVATELLTSLTHLKELREEISKTVPPLNCYLTALDHFVVEHLKTGKCRPYQPHMTATLLQDTIKSSHEIASKSPEVPVQNPAIPQTLNLSKPASVQSEDSWSMKSTISPSAEFASLEVPALIWGRHGRTNSPETPPAAATTLAIALGGTTQVTCSMTGGISNDDPLGDYLR